MKKSPKWTKSSIGRLKCSRQENGHRCNWIHFQWEILREVELERLQSSASERPRYIPKAAAIHYLNVCHSGNSRSKPAKKQKLQRLPHIWHSVNYLAQVIAILEPENRKEGRFDLFAKVKVTYSIYPVRPLRAVWLTVHDNVAVACNWLYKSLRDAGFFSFFKYVS